MTMHSITRLAFAGMMVAAAPFAARAEAPHVQDGSNSMPIQDALPQRGPNGGTLRRVGDLQLESIVTERGIQMFAFDGDGQPLPIDRGRCVATVRVEGKPKRYRYDLLPDGKRALTATVDLSPIAGRQIDVYFQLVGLPGTGNRRLVLQEVATVPATPQQQAAAAIVRQKACPVSGKLLGSMGQPVAVNVDGQTVYVCCGGCVNAIRSNPARYAAGRPEITVAAATAGDKPLIAKQKKCPVMDATLGSMGGPIKVTIGGKPIFLCCRGCIKKVRNQPVKYLTLVYDEQPRQNDDVAGGEEVRAGIFKVTAADAPFVAAQKTCPVMDAPLHAMGGPYKVSAHGKAIYICCPGCANKVAADPQKHLAVLAKRGVNAPAIR